MWTFAAGAQVGAARVAAAGVMQLEDEGKARPSGWSGNPGRPALISQGFASAKCLH